MAWFRQGQCCRWYARRRYATRYANLRKKTMKITFLQVEAAYLRAVHGESVRSIARSLGVTEGCLRFHFRGRTHPKEIRRLAFALFHAEQAKAFANAHATSGRGKCSPFVDSPSQPGRPKRAIPRPLEPLVAPHKQIQANSTKKRRGNAISSRNRCECLCSPRS